MTTELLACTARRARATASLEAPPCPDGHGAECPDRACVECGTALLLDPPMISTRRPRRPARGLSRGHATIVEPDRPARAAEHHGRAAATERVPRRRPRPRAADLPRAVESSAAPRCGPEVRVEPLRPPQRLAPWSYAVSAEIITARTARTSPPAGWSCCTTRTGTRPGTACCASSPTPPPSWNDEMGVDPMLPAVGWSWLDRRAGRTRRRPYRAAGGTVTQTTSTRFGDLHGAAHAVSLELRASWTARHRRPRARTCCAFVDLLCTAAGLPPEGVTDPPPRLT